MIVVSYDISDDKLRTRFSKYLSKFGHRLQYSVFEIDNSPRIIDNIITDIKNKFENTLYQEFYYQNLRQLSYELEKQNSILIVFGFSFADEHIAEILKRACNNPTLNIYIFCYSLDTKNEILNNLKLEEFPNNIKTILPEDNENIDFKIFLKKLFEVNSKIESDNNE